MEQDRINREKEEKEKAERDKKVKEQFDDPSPQWEKDKNVIADEALKEKKEKDKAEAKANEDDDAAKPLGSKAEEAEENKPEDKVRML